VEHPWRLGRKFANDRAGTLGGKAPDGAIKPLVDGSTILAVESLLLASEPL